MTPEQRAAYVFAQSVCAMAEIEGMKASNTERESKGYTIAYDEDAFVRVIEKYGIHANATLNLFHS